MEEKYFIKVNLVVDEKLVKETLTRIGIVNRKEKKLYQTCYLYKKDNSEDNLIIHFKEYFGIKENDEKIIKMDEIDFLRRNTIIFLLAKWNLITCEDKEYIENNKTTQKLFILNYKEKNEWEIINKVKL